MADEKRPLFYDSSPLDVPPSYDTVESASDSTSYPQEKPLCPTSQASSSSSRTPSMTQGFRGLVSKPSNSSSGWLNSRLSQTTKLSVHSTILNLIRDLVKQQPQAPNFSDVLDSCSEACYAYDISFSSLLQERSIEYHTPLYWAVIMRPPEPLDLDHDLVILLLHCSTPLTTETISDIRHACTLTSDQALFQHLRLFPSFSPLPGTDEMVLGTRIQLTLKTLGTKTEISWRLSKYWHSKSG
jgi:hypothetical protein